MSTSKLTNTADLVERIAALVRGLGISWTGPGGVYLLEETGSPPRWCVYSDVIGTGTLVTLRVEDEAIESVQEPYSEHLGALPPPPEKLRASEREILEFVRNKSLDLGLAMAVAPSSGLGRWL